MHTQAKNIQESLSINKIQNWLFSYIAEILQVIPEEIDAKVPFDEYGLDSVMVITLIADLEIWLERSLEPNTDL